MNWIVYEVVTLMEKGLQLFLRTIEEGTKPQSFFASHVKSLCIGHTESAGVVAKILQACSGIQSLALWCELSQEDIKKYRFRSSVEPLRPQRVSMRYEEMLERADVDFRQGLFSNVTHLEVLSGGRQFRGPEAWLHWSFATIGDMPKLTHMSLGVNAAYPDFDKIASIVKKILERCPHLRLCLITMSSSHDAFEQAKGMLEDIRKKDKRAVLLSSVPPTITFEDWHNHRLGEVDKWMRAERLMDANGTGGAYEVDDGDRYHQNVSAVWHSLMMRIKTSR
jgi:hypothetical protein